MITHTRVLSRPEQIQQFRAAFEQVAGNAVDTSYLEDPKTITVGCYKGTRLTGGYCLHAGPSLRYRRMLEANGHAWPEKLEASDCIEGTCAWLAQRSLANSTVMFLDFARRLQKCDESYLVAGSRIPAVARLQRKLIPNDIAVADIENGGKINQWWFYWCPRTQFSPQAVATEAVRRLRQRSPLLGSLKITQSIAGNIKHSS